MFSLVCLLCVVFQCFADRPRLDIQPKEFKTLYRPNALQFNNLRASNAASFFTVDSLKVGMKQAGLPVA